MTCDHFARRTLLAGAGCCALAAPFAGALNPLRAAAGEHTDLSPDEALQLLKEGNRAFVMEAPYRAAQGRERRLEIARSQTPFAVLVGCSDSRVPPELLFGRGLGELFIVRVAGNTVDQAALGSVEYAVAELGVPLIVVLGHERCGAVAAAIEVVERNAVLPGSIGEMVDPDPARGAEGAGTGGRPSRPMRCGRTCCAWWPGCASPDPCSWSRRTAGRLKVVGARYDLDDGAVHFFDDA